MIKLDCIFCKIISGELPSYKVFEDEFTFAFLDINPISKGHTLILPKRHAVKLTDLNAVKSEKLMRGLQKVLSGIEGALNPEGLNIFANQCEIAGQVVPHLHFHIVPRETGDGMEFITPKATLSEDEFIEVSKKISKTIEV